MSSVAIAMQETPEYAEQGDKTEDKIVDNRNIVVNTDESANEPDSNITSIKCMDVVCNRCEF